MESVLALEDGRVFRGRSIGAVGERTGEIVFNTSMSGYQEVLTDPSYRGQIVAMTYPEIGNYGVNDVDTESSRPQVSGFIVRQLSQLHSNWRASKDLNQYLRENRIVGLAEIDTRALTRHLRSRGVLRGCLSTLGEPPEALVAKAKASPDLSSVDLVGEVTCAGPYGWDQGRPQAWPEGRESPGAISAEQRELPWEQRPSLGGTARLHNGSQPHVVAYDYGAKWNILRCLRDSGCRVTIVPAAFPAADTLALQPDGVFLSNGPGDPASAGYAIEVIGELIGEVPIFGICLGHQLLGIALGARTFKLKFGHRGANQPVAEVGTGHIEITAQNHGYAIDDRNLPADIKVSHINLNDGTIEGFTHRSEPIFSVQYHPEASPGPHDSLHLFDRFLTMIQEHRGTGHEAPEPRGGR